MCVRVRVRGCVGLRGGGTKGVSLGSIASEEREETDGAAGGRRAGVMNVGADGEERTLAKYSAPAESGEALAQSEELRRAWCGCSSAGGGGCGCGRKGAQAGAAAASGRGTCAYASSGAGAA